MLVLELGLCERFWLVGSLGWQLEYLHRNLGSALLAHSLDHSCVVAR